MAETNSTSLRTIALVGVLLASVVVVLGAYTRLVDAGLGCPDWPGCYGFIGVPDTAAEISLAEERFPEVPVEAHKAWPEMVHRYFASGLGLLIIGALVIGWRARKHPLASSTPFQPPMGLLWGLLAMVCLQGAFGAWTVTLKLWPQVVTAHLLGGFTTLSLLWLLCLRLGWVPAAKLHVPRALAGLAVFATLLLVLQIALGGWVSSNYAALACPDLPTCHGQWWPEADFAAGLNLTQAVGPNYLGGQLEGDARVAIQLAHRIGALVVCAVVGLLIARLWPVNRPLALVVLVFLVTQVTLGVLNVVLVLPLANATAHNGVAALTLLALITVNYAAFTQDK